MYVYTYIQFPIQQPRLLISACENAISQIRFVSRRREKIFEFARRMACSNRIYNTNKRRHREFSGRLSDPNNTRLNDN